MTESMLLHNPRQAWGTAIAGPSEQPRTGEWPTKTSGQQRVPLAETTSHVVMVGGHEIRLCVASDPDVGFRASSRQTPLWFGYGSTAEAAVENYLGVAEAGYECMQEQGRAFTPAE